MKKLFVLITIICGVFFSITPVYAKNFHMNDFHHYIYLLDGEQNSGLGSVDDSGIDMSKYNQDQTCEGLLGDPDNPESVAWLVRELLNIAKVVGPLIVVVLSSIDFAKVIVTSDDEAMAKAGKKLAIRLVLAAALFFIPTLVTVLLDVFGITNDPTCGIQ